MKSFWLFPGQGGQRAGMLERVPSELRTQVEDWTGVKLADTEEGYQDSQQIQLSIVLLQISQIDQLLNLGWKPDLVAGHSLGVFSAAYASGVIRKEDVFKLVSLRAKLMQNAYPHGYGMGVIVGLTRREAAKLVEQVNSSTDPVYLSNQNSELQNTVSGKVSAIKQVLTLAKNTGAQKAKLLQVPNPSHSPLMQKAADELAKMVDTLELKKPNCIYLSNITGKSVRNLAGVKQDLTSNLVYPVLWDLMTSVGLEYEPQNAIEFSPGTTLSKLLKAKDKQISMITLENMSIDDADFLLNKWKGKN